MKKWEYKLVMMPKGGASLLDVERELNSHGSNGWELCATDYGCWIFKREVA